VEFSPFEHEVSNLASCQEENLGILGYLWGKCYCYNAVEEMLQYGNK